MCLYPKLIKNRKYVPNKKNKGIVPEIKDPRTVWVPVGCQKCIECRKQKARGWQVRLQEEIRTQKNAQFVTLTFNNESITELAKEIKGLDGYELDNEIATLATRRFLERWRKEYKTSVKHWLVTELGHNGTENIHLHGIIFTNNKEAITTKWKYGYVYIGKYVNETTVNYIIKYIYKTDIKHKEYNPKILTSPGVGNGYLKRPDSKLNKYNEHGPTKETYTTRQGIKLNLPIYYRNHIYTDSQKEELWLQKLDKEQRWVLGQKISIKNGDYKNYEQALKSAQHRNKQLGYGNDTKDWNRIKYENERRNLQIQKRINKTGQNNKESETDVW